jgi:tetratricopeptide (TPR) repeat protein
VSRLVLSLLLLALTQAPAAATIKTERTELDLPLARARQLVDEGKFEDAEKHLYHLLQHNPKHPEAIFLLGFVLAKQRNWGAAGEQFKETISLQPNHLPARLELAGVEFEQGRNREAIRYLREVLELDPDNDYASHFLANLLYLEEKKIEALHHWNRVGEPRINQIAFRTSTEFEAGLLQRLFSLNEGEMLRKDQIIDMRWKQKRLNLGPPFHLELTPGSQDNWDLEVTVPPRSTLSFTKTFLLLNSVRAPLYQELQLTYPARLGSGRHMSASLRWDADRKRAKALARLPFVATPSDGLRLGLDLRDENWHHTLSGKHFPYQNEGLSADYEYLFTKRRSLSIRTGYEHQLLSFEEKEDSFPQDPHLVRLGLEWNQLFGLNHSDTVQLAWKCRLDGLSVFGQEGSRARQFFTVLSLPWLIDSQSPTELTLSLGAGVSSEDLPFNHYFILGVGQDSPLPLRAHPAVQNGQKGHGPMGRNFLSANLGFQRRLSRWHVLEIHGITFSSDTAMVSNGPFGDLEKEWYQDVGFGLRMGVLGQDLVELLFGFDLKTSSFNFWVGLPN